MPVRKFRAPGDMQLAALCDAGGVRAIEMACRLSDLATRLRPRRFPPGVHRYASVEAASRAREAWERQELVPPETAGR